jgi:hypothetical protein
MKIYLDTCIYCRPFDDQSQDRIEKETKAFILASIVDLSMTNHRIELKKKRKHSLNY